MSTNVIKQTLLGEPGSQTIKMVVRSNERGPAGPQGEPGTAATITAGSAYSVPAGQAPAVMNTGTSSAAVFDFYIPKGEKGEQGPQGVPGVNGANGRDGVDGKDGVVQYTAGNGITIENNTISADATAWGDIEGTLSDQIDLSNQLQAISNSIGALGDYSTSETDTGAKWIDGSAIYKLTVDTGALPNNTSKSVPHGLGVDVIDRVIRMDGYGYAQMANACMLMPSTFLSIIVADDNIELKSTSNLSSFAESYVTIYYTKLSQ